MPVFYVSYRNKLIEFQTRQEKELVGTVYRFDHKCFRAENEFFFSFKESIKILLARTVLEGISGEFVPCLLLQKIAPRGESQFYLFSVCPDLTKFVPLRKVRDSEFLSSGISNGQISVLDGPVILSVYDSTKVSIYFSEESNMCILACQSCELPAVEENVNHFALNMKHDYSENAFLLHVSYAQNEYLVFMNQTLMCKSAPYGRASETRLIIVRYSFVDEFTFQDQKEYIPKEYHTTIVSLHHVKFERNFVNHNQNINKVIVATKEGYVIEVENGHLIRCISLCPESLLPIPVQIKQIYCPAASQYTEKTGFLVIVDKAAVALNTKLQILKKWSGISTVISGSFTEGSPVQYLLFKGNSLIEGWNIIDAHSLESYSEGSGSHDDNRTSQDEGITPDKETSDDSLNSAIEALRTRLQGERLLLYEEEQQCRRLKKFITQVSTRQQLIQEGLEPSHVTQSPDLLPLVEGPFQNSKISGNQYKSSWEPDIEIVDVWQRTYTNQWLVGVSFRNNSDSDMLVSLSLNPSRTSGFTNTLTCQSKQLLSRGKHSKHRSSRYYQNQAKFPRTGEVSHNKPCSNKNFITDYSEPEIIVGKTDIPNFGASNSYSVEVVITWTRKKPKAIECDSNIPRDVTLTHPDENNSRDTTSDKREEKADEVFSKCCGVMVLTSNDVIMRKMELDVLKDTASCDIDMQDMKESKQDLVTLMMVQQTTPLELRSTQAILTSLDQLLTERCSFMYSHRLSCYVTKIQPLVRVQLQLGAYTGGEKRVVQAYTSSDKELFLLVHHLYSCLPDHVIILLQEPSAGEVIQSCLPSLQRELHFLSHGVRKLLDHSDSKGSGSANSHIETEEDLRKVGEKFKRRKEELTEKTNRVVNSNRLKELYEEITLHGGDTDSDISKFVSKQ